MSTPPKEDSEKSTQDTKESNKENDDKKKDGLLKSAENLRTTRTRNETEASDGGGTGRSDSNDKVA
ncbi:hypothetical protein [Noviherbaspirillum sp.]|uniref:hypothetical protein n=1 Tax=Noviherbaspirillum sp. TaxID=1926288 RepID=UPI002FDFD178